MAADIFYSKFRSSPEEVRVPPEVPVSRRGLEMLPFIYYMVHKYIVLYMKGCSWYGRSILCSIWRGALDNSKKYTTCLLSRCIAFMNLDITRKLFKFWCPHCTNPSQKQRYVPLSSSKLWSSMFWTELCLSSRNSSEETCLYLLCLLCQLCLCSFDNVSSVSIICFRRKIGFSVIVL